MPGYRVGRHHGLLCRELEAIERGENKRLIVSVAPRHGKSELVSKRLPAWWFGRHPHDQIVVASYGADLAQGFGRDIRNIVQSPEYAALFPEVKVAADSSARDLWHTNKGGVFAAIGVGGGLTGRGAHLLVCDDLVRDRKDADSAVVREATFDWYRSVARTRLSTRGAIVLVMTRWHPDDVVGRLLNDQADVWRVINLPAVAGANDPLGRDIGDALWPEMFDRAALASLERDLGPREWASLYQGQPFVSEGALFKPSLIPILDASPSNIIRRVRAWDLAATRQTGTRDPDWTVGVLMAQLSTGGFLVEDVVRVRGGPDEIEATIVATGTRDGRTVPISLPQDPGQAGVAQVAYLTRRLVGFTVGATRETGDKATRAAPFASQCNVGSVSLVRAAWNRVYLDEMGSFPAGTHDDQVDASSRAFEQLTVPLPMQAAAVPFNLHRR